MSLSHQRFSDLIGSIYDCAIDPELWPGAIEQICRELHCICGVIILYDFQRALITFAKVWNFNSNSAGGHFDAFFQYAKQLMGFMLTRPLDEPYAGIPH